MLEGSTSEGPPIAVEASPWRVDVRNRLSEETEVREEHRTPPMEHKSPCTIYMVPTNIREFNSKAYDPQVVSIGPYHNGRHPFSYEGSTMQNYKWRCLRYLLRRRQNAKVGEDALLNQCLDTMMTLIPRVRSCYFDDDTHTIHRHNDEQLALMMLLDGCFIITLLLRKELDDKKSTSTSSNVGSHHTTNNGPMQELDIEVPSLGMMWIWYMVEYDLLKLENQIPFFVLENLFDLLRDPEVEKGINLVKQALQLFSNLQPGKAKKFAPPPSTKIHHLLHLFHLSLLPSGKDQRIHIQLRDNTNEEDPFPPQWIPNATELHRAGVKFRKKKNPCSFLDVTFENGVMEIPQLEIYDYTETLIRNLIAFEQCYPHTQMEITTYTLFMDCIVDTSEDVNLLDVRDIFVNRLSTDEAVADLFNGLCNQINYSLNFNFLSELFINVTRFHRSKWHRHKANLKREYFSNPWTALSVIAACILLLLTIEQSFFAAYSYFRPTK